MPGAGVTAVLMLSHALHTAPKLALPDLQKGNLPFAVISDANGIGSMLL